MPRDHAEVARLEAEAEARGGLKEGAMVTLANGQSAMVRRVDAEGVTLDCNHPLAGAPLAIRLKVVSLVRGMGLSPSSNLRATHHQ